MWGKSHRPQLTVDRIVPPLFARCGRMALMGQMSFPAYHRQRVQPCLKGSVLDCLILMGDSRLSMEISWRDRWTASEYSSCDGTVNRCTWGSRKRQVNMLPTSWCCCGQLAFLLNVHLSFSIILTLMGNQVWGVAVALPFWMPFNTISSLGVSCSVQVADCWRYT